jgi:type VI secretion system secreted protein Hcp
MAIDIFLKFSGTGTELLAGESKDSVNKNSIEILSFSFGASNSGTLASGGAAGAGKAIFQDFHFTSFTQKSSPEMLKRVATGVTAPQAIITFRKTAPYAADFLRYTFEPVLITGHNQAATGGSDGVVEEVSLAFVKIRYEYREIGADGKTTGEWKVFAFDIAANAPA